MRIYLTRSSIPEMEGLPRSEQRRAWRYAARRIWFRPLPLATAFFIIAVFILLPRLALSIAGGSLTLALLIACPILATLGLAFGSLLAHEARPYIREFRDQSPHQSPAA